MLGRVSTAVKRLASKVLDLDDTQLPVEQYRILSDFLSKHRFKSEFENLKQLVRELRKKHLVDSIVVSNSNGSLLVSTDGSSLKEAVVGSALFSYIKSEIPHSETVLIKGKDEWHMLYPYNDKIFIVRAPSHLTRTELKEIAKDVEAYLSKS